MTVVDSTICKAIAASIVGGGAPTPRYTFPHGGGAPRLAMTEVVYTLS